jgi:phenylacetate-coenzyme A ligase PaaK-like adenylate-forming protein
MYAIFKPKLYQLAQEIYEDHKQFENQKISLDEVEQRQLKQLHSVLNYVVSHSQFYKTKFSFINND